jgi:hypothetical protein
MYRTAIRDKVSHAINTDELDHIFDTDGYRVRRSIMYEKIKNDIAQEYYVKNYPNDGQRFCCLVPS